MEYEEDKAIEETREKVMVPVRRHESANEEEEEITEEPVEPKVWTPPRRWHIY